MVPVVLSLVICNARAAMDRGPHVSINRAWWEFGWPMTWLRLSRIALLPPDFESAALCCDPVWPWNALPGQDFDLLPLGVVVDAATALVLLIGTATAAERWQGRNAATMLVRRAPFLAAAVAILSALCFALFPAALGPAATTVVCAACLATCWAAVSLWRSRK
jgi:hypothetical protein